MWYFTWILGVLLACAFGIVNVMWLEVDGSFPDNEDAPPGEAGGGDGS